MKKHLYFGEKVAKYNQRVLNERELRAGGSILFIFGVVALTIAFLNGSLELLGLFAISVLIDFLIRIILNPKYSPTLVLGKIITQNQKVDYIAAIPKRFAWSVAAALAFIMNVFIILGIDTMSILAIASILIFFMFLEICFGICVGCKIYALITQQKPHLCQGKSCEKLEKQPIQEVGPFQVFTSLLYIALIIWALWLILAPPILIAQ